MPNQLLIPNDGSKRRSKSPLAQKLEREGIGNVVPEGVKKSERGRSGRREPMQSGNWQDTLGNRGSDEKNVRKNEMEMLRSKRQKEKKIHAETAKSISDLRRSREDLRNSSEDISKACENIKHSREDITSAVEEINQQIACIDNTFHLTSEQEKEDFQITPKSAKGKLVIALPKESVNMLLDQPIPPMVKSNSYCEIDTSDFNIRIKDFSPIRVNKMGDRLFTMTMETRSKNEGDNQVAIRHNNVKVKLRVDKLPGNSVTYFQNEHLSICQKDRYIPDIRTVRFTLATPPQLWRQIIQNFQKFSG